MEQCCVSLIVQKSEKHNLYCKQDMESFSKDEVESFSKEEMKSFDEEEVELL